MSRSWYLHRDGRTEGPYSDLRLREALRSGDIGPNDWVWYEGLSDWVPLRSLERSLEQEHGARGAPPPGPPTPGPLPGELVPNRRPSPETRPAGRRRTSSRSFRLAVLLALCAALFVSLSIGWRFRGAFTTGRFAEQAAPKPSNIDAAPSPRSRMPSALARQLPDATAPARMEEEPDAPAITSTLPDQAARAHRADALLRQLNSRELTTSDSATERSPAPETSRDDAREARSGTPGAEATSTLFERVEVHRRTEMSIGGLPMRNELQYRILSQLQIDTMSSGARKVQRTVESATLLASDELLRSQYEAALKALVGAKFTFTISSNGEIEDFTSTAAKPSSSPIEAIGGKGIALTSLIDDDGWKELARLSFFQPPAPPRDMPPWRLQMAHDWDALGSWSGVTVVQPPQETSAPGVQTLEYAHQMIYSAPEERTEGLPFRVLEASFEPVTAGGTIHYDPITRRVNTVAETFHVRGKLVVEMLEKSTPIQLEEVQTLRVVLSEQR